VAKHRKIIVHIAMSADGFIARPDGDVGWLDRPQSKGNYGMGEFFKTIDTILWGRKTYDKGIELGMKDTGFGPGIKNYVFSHTPKESPGRELEFVSEPVKDFARQLRAQRGKDIWMMGGAAIIAAFLDEGEIDEFSIHVIPVLIGEGIPLVQPRHRSIPLKLLSTKAFPDGVVHLNYRVLGLS
jgi:dihydrofolate reductase